MIQMLDGRALAGRIRKKIKQRVLSLATRPGLAVILVGANPASYTYVGIKQIACEETGIHFEKHLYMTTESEQTLVEKIHELNARPDIHGILVQLPLPEQDADRIIREIHPDKDVDGFHPENLARQKRGENGIVSAVALGVMKLIEESGQRRADSGEAVIVSSPLFAEPLVQLLHEQHLNTTVVNVSDPDLTQKTKTADVLIVAVGHPGLIKADMVKPGATVIDVGTTKIDGVLYGDVDFSVETIAGALSPVPGGVGPMTVAMLLVNVLKAYDLQARRNLKHDSTSK